MHSGQNTMEKNCMVGVRYNGEKLKSLGQNTQENKIVYLEKYEKKRHLR